MGNNAITGPNPAERLNLLDAMAEAKKREIRVLLSDYQKPELMQNNINGLNEQIAKLTAQRDALEYRFVNVKEMYLSACDELEALNEERKQLKHADKIARYKALQAKIKQAIAEGLDVDEILRQEKENAEAETAVQS